MFVGGELNSALLFRPQPALPAEPQIQMLRYIMIPANGVDKFKGLEIANNSFPEVDLPANVRQQNNNSWNGRVVYWSSKTDVINWLLPTSLQPWKSIPTCSQAELISAWMLCCWWRTTLFLLIKARLFSCQLWNKGFEGLLSKCFSLSKSSTKH